MDDMKDKKVLLSTLWIVAILNYLYCDIVGLMDVNLLKQYLTGSVDGMEISTGFLLGASILMEIPIIMILLSRILDYKYNRIANIISGKKMTLVQSSTLFFGTATIYYMFFSIIEITFTISIVIIASKWIEV